MIVKFTKMHSCGNDYIYVFGDIPYPEKLAAEASRRRFSIGSDGLVLLGEDEKGNKTMRIYNADGSRARICGNALKCSGCLFSREYGENDLVISTDAGERRVRVKGDEASVYFPFDGITKLSRGSVTAEGAEYEYDLIDVGNPHRVFFGNIPSGDFLLRHGKTFNASDETNADFVEVLSRDEIKLRFYERGSGETLSCGSGTVAAYYAALFRGVTDRKVRAVSAGGVQTIDNDGEAIILTSGVSVAFRGEYEYRI